MLGVHVLNSVQSAQLLSENNRVVDVFIVSDAESKAAIPEDRWPDISEKIFAKLKRRNVLNTASGDPNLAEQVSSFYISCFGGHAGTSLNNYLFNQKRGSEKKN